MPLLSKFANANTVVATGWSTPTSAYDTTAAIYNALANKPASGGGEGSQAFATAAPGKSTSITTDYGFPAFTTSDIPDGSVINSVTVEIRYKSSTTGSTGAVIGLQINKNGTLLGSESTFGMNTSDQTVTKADSSLVVADLRNANQLKARLRGFRSTSNTAITWSVDYVRVTVDYTPTSTGSATLALVPALVAAGAVAVQAALAKALGLALSAAGAALVKGDLSRTLTLSLSASGAVRVKGDSSLTLGPSLSAAGTVANAVRTGDASLVLPLGLAASGQVAVGGGAALALTPSLAAAAVLPIRGDAALVLPLAFTAAGMLAVKGGAALVLAPSLAAAGRAPLVATAALTLPLQLTATGKTSQSSIGDAALPLPLALTATGAVRVGGAAQLRLDLQPLALAVVAVKGDGVMVIPLALGSTGAVRLQGDADLRLPLLFAATGHVPSTGRVWSWRDPDPPPASHESKWTPGTVAPPTGYSHEWSWTWPGVGGS